MDLRIQDQLAELGAPGVFPEAGPVEVLQTHISVVCLAGDRAYKLKKALRLPFVDFSTRPLRQRACDDEVRLNRRLCPDVYLEVSPVRRTAAGLRVADAPPLGGEVVDHAVRMVRLPQSEMLDCRLADGRVSPSDLEVLARLVAEFHAHGARDADDSVRDAGSPDRLIPQIVANFEQTRPMVGDRFDPELHAAVAARVQAGLPDLHRALARRAVEGRIVDGHGDLHARNICMVDPPAIYDCIEFRKDFRCGDVATEIAFLTMDLRFRGHPDLAARFVEAYVAASGDGGVRPVLPELVRYRAMVRAKIDSIAASDESIEPAERERSSKAARRRLRLCAWSRIEADGPLLLVATGLPASGKSALLGRVASEAGWPIFATDRTRKELAGAAPDARLDERYYTPQWSDRTYAAVLQHAASAAGCAIADGNFPTVARRQAAVAAAGRAGKRCVFVHVAVDDAVARERLRARAADGDAVSDADERVFELVRSRYEAPTSGEAGAVVVRVDGAAPGTSALDALARALLETRSA